MKRILFQLIKLKLSSTNNDGECDCGDKEDSQDTSGDSDDGVVIMVMVVGIKNMARI